MISELKDFILRIQEIKPLEIIPLLGLFFYNLIQIKKVSRVKNFFFLIVFFLIHLVSILYQESVHANVLCIEFIFIIFWFKFPKKTTFYHFLVLFFFSVLIIFLDNFNITEIVNISQKYKIKNFNYILLYGLTLYIFHLFFFQKKIFTSSSYYIKIFLLYFLIIFFNLNRIFFLDQELSKYIMFLIFIYSFYVYLLYKNYINYRNLKIAKNKIYINIIIILTFLNYQIIGKFESGYFFELKMFLVLNFINLFKVNFKKEGNLLASSTKINHAYFFILNLNLIISHLFVFFLSLKIKSAILNYSIIGILFISLYCIFKYCFILKKHYSDIFKDQGIKFDITKDKIDVFAIIIFALNIVIFYFLNKYFVSQININNLYLLSFDKRIVFFAAGVLVFYQTKNFFEEILNYLLRAGAFFLHAVKIAIESFYVSFVEYFFLLKIKINRIGKVAIALNIENRILNANNIIVIAMILLLFLVVLNYIFK